ncbi:Reductase [Kitasatospora sp. MMS16-BH015]|uniref:NAD-dependent epimerase/dehydratase family protein n=1 Tax=Kitasatospora sp. MMS16-BH015 TaxID=2018025 RepID=UPI000CA0BB48|nr:NAD-dependent epimerase/dehydratase family protein [Kitasatospora sp. MMS16-BH015]AUG76432.1 Reductase [Kitasatospora sp. MMS16-BH015]
MDVCVIGGSRYFGRRLIELLRDAGAAVTVINRGSTPAPPGVTHLRSDRNDEAALRAALGDRRFDVVIDQVCYTPVQAAIAARVFAGRTPRYLLTSTVEVYAELGRPGGPALPESAFDPTTWPVDLELPWSDPEFCGDHYGEGKRQAEALLTRLAPFELVTVRTAHVLGGADFTGRLAHYVERIGQGHPVAVHPEPQPATFVHAPEIAAFLAWAATAAFTGPVNAASPDPLDARELSTVVGRVLGAEPRLTVPPTPPSDPTPTSASTATPASASASADEELSPFSFEHCYAMDTTRAAELGFTFTPAATWLPLAVRELHA